MFSQLDLFFASAMEEETPKPKVSESDLQKAHDKQYKQKLLEPKEWELYRLIKYNSEVLDRRTTQKEICEKLGLKYNDSITAHDKCPKIWTMISHLNLSGEIEKIIISYNFEYWLGNQAETQVYLDKLWNDLEPRLVRYWAFLRKIKKNGQGKLLSTQLEPIDENSQAREFVESFLEE